MKIYTRAGDSGKTSLLNGKKIFKHFIEIDVIGNIDELQSYIGLLTTRHELRKEANMLFDIQKDLFYIMSYIAGKTIDIDFLKTRINFFEKTIDMISPRLEVQNEFIIPGKTEVSATLQVSRAICRRVERIVIELFYKKKTITKKDRQAIIGYFNRLSDLLFTLARKKA